MATSGFARGKTTKGERESEKLPEAEMEVFAKAEPPYSEEPLTKKLERRRRIIEDAPARNGRGGSMIALPRKRRRTS